MEEGNLKDTKIEDSKFEWNYGKNSSKIKTYEILEEVKPKVVATQNEKFSFRTPDSFLNSLKKAQEEQIDLTRYKPGIRVDHKRFGEGTINKVEQEGNDLKIDIEFDKVGHKRLMAKYAKLKII